MFHLDEEPHSFGTVKVGERGQIVIPKDTRELFDIKPGDNLLLIASKKRGIVILKSDAVKEVAQKILSKIETIEKDK